jgi:flagellar protein FliL
MAQDSKPAEAEAPKSKKKLIIIIVAVLILALGGGGAAWFFMQKKPPAKAGHKTEQQAEEHEEAAAEEEPAEEEHEGGGHGGAGPVFLTLEAFTVNLQPDPDEKYLQLEMSLQVPSAEVAEKMKGQMPALRNRLLLLLSSKSSKDISTLEGKQKLTQEILDEVKKPFTEKGKPQKVTGVFFTSFVIQ